MKTLIFLDTETTGAGPEDRLCQLAYIHPDITVNELFKPPVPIGLVASSITHITNDMVVDKPSFKGSPDYSVLSFISQKPDTVLVAHNAQFDLSMLKKEGIEFPQHICTLKVARFLDTGTRFERYTLQYLRYYYNVEVDATAHDALGDVKVLIPVFEALKNELMEIEQIDEEAAIERMISISANPTLYKTFNFGKHQGKLVKDVDRDYLKWLLNAKLQNPQGEEDWIYTLNEALK